MIIINPINAAVFDSVEDNQSQEHADEDMSTGEYTSSRQGHFEPNVNDVLCARGKRAYYHSGNKRFRHLVETKMDAYNNANCKLEKSLIVSSIVEAVRQADPPGGFFREEDGQWMEIGDSAAREKVGQGFRDLLHTKYKSATKAKKRVRLEKSKAANKGYEEAENPPSSNKATKSVGFAEDVTPSLDTESTGEEPEERLEVSGAVDEQSFQTEDTTMNTEMECEKLDQAKLLEMPLLLSSYSVELKKAEADLEPLPMSSEQRAYRASFVARLSSIDWDGEEEQS